MKRFIIAMALTLVAPWMASAKLNIVTTTPDLAATARDIAGDLATVNSIGPGEDPHFIEAKPSHIVTLNKADVFIEVGMELEIGWLPALLDQARNAKIRAGARLATRAAAAAHRGRRGEAARDADQLRPRPRTRRHRPGTGPPRNRRRRHPPDRRESHVRDRRGADSSQLTAHSPESGAVGCQLSAALRAIPR